MAIGNYQHFKTHQRFNFTLYARAFCLFLLVIHFNCCESLFIVTKFSYFVQAKSKAGWIFYNCLSTYIEILNSMISHYIFQVQQSSKQNYDNDIVGFGEFALSVLEYLQDQGLNISRLNFSLILFPFTLSYFTFNSFSFFFRFLNLFLPWIWFDYFYLIAMSLFFQLRQL